MTDTPKPEPPRHLSAESRVLWRQILDAFDFEEWELKTLRLALEALDRGSTARRALRRLGLTYDDRFGTPHSRPEVQIERDARRAWIECMKALALPTDLDEEGQPRNLRGHWESPRRDGRPRLAKVAG
jgi:phage terminase small subunit